MCRFVIAIDRSYWSRMPKKSDLAVSLHWFWVEGDDDSRWRHDLALYAYLAPFKAEIYYLGKCDRTSAFAGGPPIARRPAPGIALTNSAKRTG